MIITLSFIIQKHIFVNIKNVFILNESNCFDFWSNVNNVNNDDSENNVNNNNEENTQIKYFFYCYIYKLFFTSYKITKKLFFIKHKFSYIHSILNNIFIIDERKEEFLNYFYKIQRTYYALNKFAYIYKFKKASIKVNNDFLENGGLVMVGNIKTVKNQGFGLELVKELREQIDIIGKVQDLDYYNKICNICPEGVNFMQEIDNVSHLLGRYKIGLFCSISESGPLVLLEYFVQGLPFIAYRTGGISDVLFKYVPQYFMDTFDMDRWVEKYQQLNDRVLRKEVKAKTRKN